MKVVLGFAGILTVGAFVFAALGGKRPAKASPSALSDSTMSFQVVSDEQAVRVAEAFEAVGQVLNMSYDGSVLTIEFRGEKGARAGALQALKGEAELVLLPGGG
jgi:hypothetical protein